MSFHHPSGELVRITEWSTDTGISIPLINAVAAAKNEPPTELEPLYNIIDPDALDQLFRIPDQSRPLSASVQFPYLEFIIVVEAHGRIFLYERPTGSAT